MSNRQLPHRDSKMSAQGYPWVLNERSGNPHITRQTVARMATSDIYHLPQFSIVLFIKIAVIQSHV